MQAAAHPRPVRVIVELDPGMLTPVLQTLVQAVTTALTPRPHPTASPAQNEDEGDPAPRRVPEHDPPVVVATRQQPAAAVTALPPGTVLGDLCLRGHRHAGQRQSLRRASNGKCIACVTQQDRRRNARRPPTPPGPPAPVRAPAPPPRPELPGHWEGRGFLSPIVCENLQHRFRDTPFTLRYLDSEQCVQCCSDASTALAGD